MDFVELEFRRIGLERLLRVSESAMEVRCWQARTALAMASDGTGVRRGSDLVASGVLLIEVSRRFRRLGCPCYLSERVRLGFRR